MAFPQSNQGYLDLTKPTQQKRYGLEASIPNVRSMIPSIKIGGDKPPQNQPPQDPFWETWRRRIFLLLIILVGGSAALLIAIKLIGRFF